MNILFPTDFSDNANLAKDYATHLAQKTNGKIHVLHAYELPYADRSLSFSLLDKMKEFANENMAEFEANFKDSAFEFETHVQLGNPIRLIEEFIKKREVDIVVMGTKGASGVEEFLIGSNAASIIHNVNVPVLVIPPKAENKNLDTIVLATDLDLKNKRQPLERLANLAKVYGSKVEILHLQKEHGASGDSRALVEEVLKDIPHTYTIAGGGNVESAILEHCELKNANAIAAITKKYGFFERLFHSSLTSKLAYHSSIPLVALHEPEH